MKRCQSCGRLTELLEDFAGLDQDGIYCSSCADDFGKLKSFDEVVENLTQRIAKTDGFDVEASRKAAQQILGRQPAWEPKFRKEEGMKTNKRRLVLIAVAVVFALSAGGATWWVTSRYYDNRGNPYEIHIASYDNPFKDIETYDSNGFKISEFRCKGDQIITNLENGILQFESYEDPGYLLGSKKFVNMDAMLTSSFVFNLVSGKGMDLRSIGIWENDQKTKQLIEIVNARLSSVQWNMSFNAEDEERLETDFRNDDQVSISNVREKIVFDLVNNKPIFEGSDANVLYRYGSKSVEVSLAMVGNRYHLDNYLFIFGGQNFSPVMKRKINLYDRVVHPIGAKDNIAVFDCQKESNADIKSFVVVDLNNDSLFYIPADYCEFVKMVDKNRFIYRNDQQELILFDIPTRKQQTIGKKENNMYIGGVVPDGSADIVLIIYDNQMQAKSFWLMSAKDGSLKKVNDGEYMTYEGMVGRNIVWTTFGENMKYSEDEKVVAKQNKVVDKGKVMLTNLDTGKTTTVISELRYPIDVFCDGSYIAWTKYAGPKDDQWKNVCWTKIP